MPDPRVANLARVLVNYCIEVQEDHIMAIGAGHPETGSLNKSAVHMDMVCDMRQGGPIHIDGELFYDSGEFKI